MNTIQRFFRRYIFSTVGIVLLFLFVNIALIFTILVVGSMSNSDVVFSVRQFSDHITKQGGDWTPMTPLCPCCRRNPPGPWY